MESLFALTRAIAPKFLRYSMALILLWIGGLKFADPSPVVGLLQASFSFLASNQVVYLLGLVEVILAILLAAGIGVRYVGLAVMGLFVGTLAIFLIAPAVTYGDRGFPFLSLPGEFLLKDLVLMAAAMALVAMESGEAHAHATDKVRAAA